MWAASVCLRKVRADQVFTLDSLLGESFPPSLCFRGFRILVEGMCHLASVDTKGKADCRQAADTHRQQYMPVKLSNHCTLYALWDLPADLVLSRVGSLSLWISPSPPWMSPASSWRIGDGQLQRENKGGENDFLPLKRALYSIQTMLSTDLAVMCSN